MPYLLDTNIFIYAAIDRDSLSRDVKAILDNYDNTFYMSSESVKELIVGFNNGKLVSRFWDTAAKMVKDACPWYRATANSSFTKTKGWNWCSTKNSSPMPPLTLTSDSVFIRRNLEDFEQARSSLAAPDVRTDALRCLTIGGGRNGVVVGMRSGSRITPPRP